MIGQLIRFSLAHRWMVMIAAVALTIVGLYSLRSMSVDVFPDLTAPTVTVIAEAHGMAPTEVENLITFPIEVVMNGASGVRRVRSSTSLGIAVVWVEFEWGADVLAARQIVNEKLSLVRSSLPEGIEPPIMAPQSSIMGEVLFIGLASDRHSMFDVRTMADTTVRRRLLSVPGVSQVIPIGGEVKQYQVILSPAKLQAFQLSAAEVAEAVGQTNQNVSAGLLVEGGQEFLIQGIGRIRQIEQIADTVVTVRDGVGIRVGQVGNVQIGPALKRGEGSAMGKPTVILGIQKQPGVNTLVLSESLDHTLDEISAALPEGMTIRRDLFRQADFISLAVRNIEHALRDGGILVVIVVLLFLGNLRASAITLTAIPLSLVTAILVLRYFGATINTMTLGGLAIAIGELVDDAIVDVENVLRRLRENATRPLADRRSPLQVIYTASLEIRSSIVFATLIVTLVFLPLFFLSGIEGRLLQPLGIAYIVALVASLIVAVTVTPALCALLLPQAKSVQEHGETKLVHLLKRFYAPVLENAVNRPWLTGGIAAVLFCAAMSYLPFAGQSFLPEFNEGSLTVEAWTLPGTSLVNSNRLGHEVEVALLKLPEVISVARRTGRAERDEHAQGVEASELDVRLDMHRPATLGQPVRSKDELLEAIRRDLAEVPGMQIAIGQPISHRIDHMLSGTRTAIALKLFAPEQDRASLPKLRELGIQLKNLIEDVPGVVDLSVESQADVPTFEIEFDRPAIAQQGLQIKDVADELGRAFAGQVVSQVLEGRNNFDLVVRISEPGKVTENEIRNLAVTTPGGAKIPLRGLAAIREGRGPNRISREHAQRKLVVQCNVAGRDLVSVVDEIRNRVGQSLPLGQGAYAGYSIEYSGQFESAQETSRLLLILGCGVVVGIGLLLHLALHSIRDALLVMLNLPLALIGGVVGLYLSGGVLSIATLVGFITLLGIATRNGIMLVTHIRHLQREEGEPDFRRAVVRGALERLSPILMTALCAGLALIPLALSGGSPGNEIQTPLAIVVLFGLLSSTLLNMLVVPSLFLALARAEPPLEAKHAMSELSATPELAAAGH